MTWRAPCGYSEALWVLNQDYGCLGTHRYKNTPLVKVSEAQCQPQIRRRNEKKVRFDAYYEMLELSRVLVNLSMKQTIIKDTIKIRKFSPWKLVTQEPLIHNTLLWLKLVNYENLKTVFTSEVTPKAQRIRPERDMHVKEQ